MMTFFVEQYRFISVSVPMTHFFFLFITREFDRKIKAMFSSSECESTELLRFLSVSDPAGPSMR